MYQPHKQDLVVDTTSVKTPGTQLQCEPSSEVVEAKFVPILSTLYFSTEGGEWLALRSGRFPTGTV